jgi:hypothetical protein
MSPQEQQAFFESFESYEAFFAWLEEAKRVYEENQNRTEVGGDGSIDVGDLIGGGGDDEGGDGNG